MQRWEVRDLGDVTEFLCMHIIKIGRMINIDQCDYLNTVLQCCRMENTKSATTPLLAGYMPEPAAPDVTIDPELQSRYQTVIGSLLYLMLGTRPDITFAVTKLAQYAARPTKEHLQKALNICCYLVGTKNYCITYNSFSGQGLMACTDSDWASDLFNRKSQSGYFLKLAGGAISWTSRAQKTIALSSTEAEHMVFSDCCRQVVWMHTLLGKLSYNLKPIPIYHRRFFHLQPSSRLITLIPTNDPSPASIPACPAVFRLAHNSQPLPHNLARPTVSRTIVHPCRLLPF